MEHQMFSYDGTPMLIIKFIVYALFQGLLVIYLLGISSKGGLFDFLHHSASVGDVIVIVGAGIFMLDDLAYSRNEHVEIISKERFDKIEISLMKIEGMLRYNKQ
jgi:hypothetical protein